MLNPIELRHILHQNPELMFHEFMATDLLKENLAELDKIKIYRPLETGLVVEYRVNDGGFLLFRADIDALPIKEETGAEFKSLNNNMHACGHDIHTSILYGFINEVIRRKVNQNIVFLFQPGEEGGGGALKIIESGILKNYNIISAFALHVTDDYPANTIASTPGVLFASAFEIDIEIYGKSAHVAFPENGIHSFNAFRIFLDELDLLLKDYPEKVIFGYGRIESGTARNIIPYLTRAECTIRSLNKNNSLELLSRIRNILENVKAKTKADFSVNEGPFYSEVTVDRDLFERMNKTLSKKYNFIDCGYKMTGEDFGFFSHLYPSFMFWLGTSEGPRHGLHTSKFLPDDSVIQSGINIFSDILKEMGNGK